MTKISGVVPARARADGGARPSQALLQVHRTVVQGARTGEMPLGRKGFVFSAGRVNQRGDPFNGRPMSASSRARAARWSRRAVMRLFRAVLRAAWEVRTSSSVAA